MKLHTRHVLIVVLIGVLLLVVVSLARGEAGRAPAEALIYGWVPFYRRRRLCERLAGIRVSVRVSPPAPDKVQRGAVLVSTTTL